MAIPLSDIYELMELIPYGMTVVMTGLFGLAHLPEKMVCDLPLRKIVNDLQTAQLICRRYNAVATLYREMKNGEIFNPVILKTYVKYKIDIKNIHELLKGERKNEMNLISHQKKMIEYENNLLFEDFFD